MTTKRTMQLIEAKKSNLLGVLPVSLKGRMTWENIKSQVGMAVAGSRALQECESASIYTSVLYILHLGLEIGGHAGQAYLIPYNGKCTPMVGAQGKIELAYRSGSIDAIRSAVVYENDRFDLDLATGEISHRPALRGGRGDILGTWAGIWVSGRPDPIIEWFAEEDFNKIRNEAKRKNRGKESPAYANWPGEMRRRSAINRALKRAPKSRDLLDVLQESMAVESGASINEVGDVDFESVPVSESAQIAQDFGMPEVIEAEPEKVTVKTTPPPVRKPNNMPPAAPYQDEF